MNYHVLTLFPEMILQGLNTSIIGRAIEKGILSLEAVNIRDYAGNRYGKVDDYPYGGGAGMVMQAEPVYAAVKDLEERMSHKPRVIYLTPQGRVFRQEMAVDFAKEEDLVFLCGHYEGIDERVLEEVVTDYVSIGDYVPDRRRASGYGHDRCHFPYGPRGFEQRRVRHNRVLS